MYEFIKVKGAVKPAEIDTESSSYYAYNRKKLKNAMKKTSMVGLMKNVRF